MRVHTMCELGAGQCTLPDKHTSRLLRRRDLQQGEPSAREIECLLYDSHQKGKMMIMIVKTPGSQVDSPVAEGNRQASFRKQSRELREIECLLNDNHQKGKMMIMIMRTELFCEK